MVEALELHWRVAVCNSGPGLCAVQRSRIDIRLAGGSGLGLPPRLEARGVRLPFVFISGHADVPTTAQAFKLGAVDLLQKPIHEQSLLELAPYAQQLDSADSAR